MEGAERRPGWRKKFDPEQRGGGQGRKYRPAHVREWTLDMVRTMEGLDRFLN
jgi:hypothetical protein